MMFSATGQAFCDLMLSHSKLIERYKIQRAQLHGAENDFKQIVKQRDFGAKQFNNSMINVLEREAEYTLHAPTLTPDKQKANNERYRAQQKHASKPTQ